MALNTGLTAIPKKTRGSSDIFEKCRTFTRPYDLQDAGLYMYFETFGDREGCAPGEVRLGDRKVLMFGSNDYMDLITHPYVEECAAQALHKYGSGCSGSRLLNGTLDLHVKLEAELAAFVRKEAAIIFGTGFQANYATLSALTEKGDVMICDHNLHASLVEGALRSPARVMRFRHNDLEHFGRCLNNCPPEDKILVVSEGVFSMEGDLADLQGLVEKSKPYGARIYVDEAHGLGVLGPTGAGAAEHLGVLDDVDLVMGTFSKALGERGRLHRRFAHRDRLLEAHRAAFRIFGEPSGRIRRRRGRSARNHQEGAGTPQTASYCSPTAQARTSCARLHRARWRNCDCAGSDPRGSGPVPAVQGPARRRDLHQPGAQACRGAEPVAHLLHLCAHRSAHRPISEDVEARRCTARHRGIAVTASTASFGRGSVSETEME